MRKRKEGTGEIEKDDEEEEGKEREKKRRRNAMDGKQGNSIRELKERREGVGEDVTKEKSCRLFHPCPLQR